jgi:hypothetical protein
MRRAQLLLAGLAATLPLLVAPIGASADAADGPVRLVARIDGRPIADATEQHPVALRPDDPVTLSLRLTNDGADDLTVHAVRLEGRVMGLTFFAYDTRVELVLEAGSTTTSRFQLDLVGLDGQATGLVPARVAVLDADRHELASQASVVDVRGSLRSVYGAFGLAVAVFTGLSLAGALVALARHRLSPNRWRRGIRFLWAGVGVGLLIVFTLSALRVFVPQPGRWVPIVAVSTGLLFVLGYLTPSPEEPEDREAEEPDAPEHLAASEGTPVAASMEGADA